MIASTLEGVVIDIRVVPRAGRAGIAGTRDDALLVRLHAPPVEGAANAELIEVIAKALRVPRRSVTIVAGERARLKRVRVTGIDAAAAARALTAREADRKGPPRT